MQQIFAWLGGGLFVASLAYTIYFYIVMLGRTDVAADTDPQSAIAINAALFSVFALHHSILARAGAKRWITSWVPPQLERSLYVWIASLLLIAVCVFWQPVPGMLYAVGDPWRWGFYALQVAGYALTARTAAILDGLELAGIRQVQRRQRPPSDFRADGPFGIVRHPIYLGWILLVFGAPTMTINRLVFAVVSSLYLILAIPWEERSLVAASGDRYRAYQQKVRWRLVPGIW